MPVKPEVSIARVDGGLRILPAKKGKMITLEYILIAGVNDDVEQSRPLARLARRLKAKLNLIPYNRVDGLSWERPTDEAQEAFLGALEAKDSPPRCAVKKATTSPPPAASCG